MAIKKNISHSTAGSREVRKHMPAGKKQKSLLQWALNLYSPKEIQPSKIENKRHYFFLGTLTLIYILMIIIVNPVGDFALNDDWIFAHPVFSILKTGNYGSDTWSAPIFISQVFWGLLFCLFTGFSFTTLRFSTLVLAIAGIYIVYFLTYNLSKSKRLSFILALLLLVNPLYFCLSNTFMTDVPFASMALFSLYFFIRYSDTGKSKFIVLAALFSVIASLIRQFGLIIPVAYTITYAFKKRKTLQQHILQFIPIIITLVCFKIASEWLKHIGAESNASVSAGINAIIKQPIGWMGEGFKRYTTDLFYFGLLFLPLPLFIAINVKSLKSRYISIACLTGFAVYFILYYRNFPCSDYLNSAYLGPMTVTEYMGSHINYDDYYIFSRFDLIIIYILGISGAMLAVFGLRNLLVRFGNPFKVIVKDYSTISKYFFIALCTIGYASLLFLREAQFDRYMIPLFPLIGLLIIPEPGNKLLLSSPLLVIFAILYISVVALFSALGTHDYLALNRARMHAADYLLSDRKISIHKIDAGYETNGWLLGFDGRKYDVNKTWYGVVDGYEYFLSLNEVVDGFELVKKFPYKNYIPPRTKYIYIMHWFGAEFNEGLALIRRGKTDSADIIINEIQQAAQFKPAPHLHNYLGMLYTEKNMNGEAEKEFKKEIALNLQKEEAYIHLGMIYFNNRDAARAINCFDSTLILNPSNADAYGNLGCCYLNFKNDSKKAQELFVKALELNPDNTGAYINILIAAQNNKDEETLIKYAKVALKKGLNINEIRAKGIIIPDDIMKKINS